MPIDPHSTPTTEQVWITFSTGQQLYRLLPPAIYCFIPVELLRLPRQTLLRDQPCSRRRAVQEEKLVKGSNVSFSYYELSTSQ